MCTMVHHRHNLGYMQALDILAGDKVVNLAL